MNRPTPGAVEERSAPHPAAAPIIDGRKLRGLIPYGVESRDMGGWREVIDPGALDGADLGDLIATREHDRARLLGRHPTTLQTEDRSDGFAWSAELPNSPVGEDVRVAVERGDLRSSSWRMVVDPDGGDYWQGAVRHVKRIKALLDVAVTAAPRTRQPPQSFAAHPTRPPARRNTPWPIRPSSRTRRPRTGRSARTTRPLAAPARRRALAACR